MCCLVEVLLLVRDDRAVRGRVHDAREHEAGAHLVVVEEGLVGLVDGSGRHLSGARGARSRAARVGQVDALLLSLVQNVNVARALNLFAGVLG